MLDLYKPFTSATNMSSYMLQIKNFISQLQLFRTIPANNIELTDTSVRFNLDSLGLQYAYIDIHQDTFYGNSPHINVATNMENYLYANEVTSSSMCKIFTLQTPNTSGFWFYTLNYAYICKIILTDVVDITKNINNHRWVLIAAYQHNSEPLTNALYVQYNGYMRDTVPTATKWNKFDDTSTFVLDNLYNNTYKFTDVYVLSGGNTSSEYKECMIFNDTQYIQLAGNIYVKNTNATI